MEDTQTVLAVVFRLRLSKRPSNRLIGQPWTSRWKPRLYIRP